MIEPTDPRSFPDAASAPPAAARLHALAEASLGAQALGEADALDASLDRALAEIVEVGRGDLLAATLDTAPSVAVCRHLWRALLRVAGRPAGSEGGLGMALFALPIVLVLGRTGGGTAPRVPGVLRQPEELAALLVEHRVLGGNETFALANALVSAESIGPGALPALVAATRLSQPTRAFAPVALPEAPFDVPDGESVHLRFVVGSALATPGFDLGALVASTGWMRPFAQSLASQLALPGASLLALPRPPQSLPAALASGRAAQRDVSAQLFASNALRQIRASTGEPVAVISAHAAPDAPGGGELRLSLSSPFEPRDAQGFRCPLYPWERVGDVAAMLVALLQDCRVADIRSVSGVHPDRSAVTGGPLLFKPETIPTGTAARPH